MKENLFPWLVQYHYKNLQSMLKFIQNGKFIDPYTNEPVEEGIFENHYKGVLIVSNGNTLEKLLKDDIILDVDRDENNNPKFSKVYSIEDFFSYFDSQHGDDGAYVYDNSHEGISRTYVLKNDSEKMPHGFNSVIDSIPTDFIYSSRDHRVSQDNVGNKTRLAIKLPKAYENMESVQIKRTAYTPLGLGKVTHFTDKGLDEEFFFKYDPNSTNLIIPEKGITGVYRKYFWQNNRPKIYTEEKIEKEYFNEIKNYLHPSKNSSLVSI